MRRISLPLLGSLALLAVVAICLMPAQAEARDTYDWWSHVNGRDVRGPVSKGNLSLGASLTVDDFEDPNFLADAFAILEVSTNDFGVQGPFAVSGFVSWGHQFINDFGDEGPHVLEVGAKFGFLNPQSTSDTFVAAAYASALIQVDDTKFFSSSQTPYLAGTTDVSFRFGGSMALRAGTEFFIGAILDFVVLNYQSSLLEDTLAFTGRPFIAYVPDNDDIYFRGGIDFSITDATGDDIDIMPWVNVEISGIYIELMYFAQTDGNQEMRAVAGFNLTFAGLGG